MDYRQPIEPEVIMLVAVGFALKGASAAGERRLAEVSDSEEELVRV